MKHPLREMTQKRTSVTRIKSFTTRISLLFRGTWRNPVQGTLRLYLMIGGTIPPVRKSLRSHESFSKGSGIRRQRPHPLGGHHEIDDFILPICAVRTGYTYILTSTNQTRDFLTDRRSRTVLPR